MLSLHHGSAPAGGMEAAQACPQCLLDFSLGTLVVPLCVLLVYANESAE